MLARSFIIRTYGLRQLIFLISREDKSFFQPGQELIAERRFYTENARRNKSHVLALCAAYTCRMVLHASSLLENAQNLQFSVHKGN